MTIIRIVQLKLKEHSTSDLSKPSLQGYTTKDRQLFQSYLVGYGKKTDNSCVPNNNEQLSGMAREPFTLHESVDEVNPYLPPA